MIRLLFITLLFLVACTPSAAPARTAQVVSVYATPVTQPWLVDAYNCAQELQIILSNINDPKQADISIRMGEPGQVSFPIYQTYQIDQDDLLVVTHRESQLQDLTAAQVQSLFSRPESPAVQIWVFAAGEDIQQVFAQEVLRGQAPIQIARVAVSPQQMSDTLNQDKNAVGILPRRWKVATVRDVFMLPKVPILALVKSEPQGLTKALLACLQNNNKK